MANKKESKPKTFYDFQLQNPKNMSNLNKIHKAVFEDLKSGQDAITREQRLIQEATKNKEEELRFWKDAMSKLSEKQEPLDDSIGDFSVQGQYRKGILEDEAKGSRVSMYKQAPITKGEEVHIDEAKMNPNEPISRPTMNIGEDFGQYREDQPERPTRRGLKSGISKIHNGPLQVAGPINPNQYIHNEFSNIPQFDNRMHYDANDNDINRNANKAYNDVTHIMFLGAGRPANDDEMDRLRKVQRNMASKEMLLGQIRDNQRKKLMERERLKREDDAENERIKRDVEIMNKRLAEEKRKETDKKKQFQMENMQIAEDKNAQSKKDYHAVKSSMKEKSSFLGGIDAQSKVISEHDLEEELKNASGQMQSNRERVRNQLEEELFKEKEFMMMLPEEINKKINMIMNQQLDRMKVDLNQGTNQLRDNILNLRSKAIELDEERRRAAHEVNKLRSHLAQVQYEDDIRTDEMLSALADDNLNRILPSSSRFNMPEALIRDYEEYNFPISQYESTQNMSGSDKLYSEGYLDNDYMKDLDGSNNIRNVSRRVNMYGDASTSAALADSYKVEDIYNRNLMRDKVFADSLENRVGHFGLQDYLSRDLEESRRAAGEGFDFNF